MWFTILNHRLLIIVTKYYSFWWQCICFNSFSGISFFLSWHLISFVVPLCAKFWQNMSFAGFLFERNENCKGSIQKTFLFAIAFLLKNFSAHFAQKVTNVFCNFCITLYFFYVTSSSELKNYMKVLWYREVKVIF